MEVIKIIELLPAEVLSICERLVAQNERGYVVGGSIRDVLMGRPAHDWDIATTASPSKVMRLFPRTVPTGVAHGTVTVLIGQKGFEVTTLRGEGAYSDGRHPDAVEFIDDVTEDLARRDFTINAIAFDPVSSELFDPFDGRGDIERRVIRAVGDPLVRFNEDGLRVMRAARFASTLEFLIEPGTLAAMKRAASMLQKVSAERKRDELFKLLFSPRPSVGISIVQENGLDEYVLPQLALEKAQANRFRARLDDLPGNLPLRVAALLLPVDLRRPVPSGLPHRMRSALRGLKSDRHTITVASELVSLAHFDYSSHWSDAQLRRLLKVAGGSDVQVLIALWKADARALGESSYLVLASELSTRLSDELSKQPPLRIADLVIGGRDLMGELNVPAGPKIGELLDGLLECVLDDPKKNERDVLLEEARSVIGGQDKSFD